ncbi:MAG: TolC family protein [Planctomycetota bacterium]
MSLALTAGCVSYRPEPLDPRALLHELQEIRLEAVRSDITRAGSPDPEASRAVDANRALSADEAVAVALFLSPELRAARRVRGVAAGELVSAGLLSNPTIGASWLHIQGFTTSFASGLIDLGLSWVPPRPGEIDAKQSLARARVDEVDAEIAAAEWRLAADVRKAHLGVLIAEEQRRLAEGLLKLQERVRQFVRDKRGLGDATDLDASFAEVEYASALQGQALAAADLERALQELNTLLGLPPLAAVELDAGGELAEPDLTKLDPPRLEQLMLEHRPDIAAARSAYEQAEQRLRLACLVSWPWFGAGPQYERDAGDGNSSINKIGGAVDLDLPIFNFNQGEIAALEANRARLREEFRSRVYRGRAEVNEALRSLRAQQRLITIYRDTVQPALDENARLTETGVTLGDFNLVQLIATQDKALRTRREFLAARLEFGSALFELERSLGRRLADLGSDKE